MPSQRSAGFGLSPIVIATVTMLTVLVLAITQVLPGGAPRADPNGVALVMVAGVAFALITLTVAFVRFLSREERGESGPSGARLGPLFFVLPATLIVLVLAISQQVPGVVGGLDGVGTALAMVAVVLFALIVITVAFVRFLSADERGAFD